MSTSHAPEAAVPTVLGLDVLAALSECNCNQFGYEYAHVHCANCAGKLWGEGGGGDDGRSIGGYTDATICVDCREYICHSCDDKPVCADGKNRCRYCVAVQAVAA